MGKYDRVDTMCPISRQIGLQDTLEALEDIDFESVAALETVVGDESAGLVKDVSDLETVVGDDSAGLVKDVADLKAAVGAPTLAGATLDETKKLVDIEMSAVIFNAISFDPIGMKDNITIAADGTTFNALAAGDTINMSGRILRVSLDAALTLATNKIKIAADTLVSVAGVKNAEIVTDAIDATGV
jgi:hypothetical protein